VNEKALVRVQSDPVWDLSVSAVGRGLSLFVISGPGEAFDFLSHEWPARRGQIFADAHRANRDAAHGTVPPEAARAAFIYACEDAGCLVRRPASR